MAKFGSYSQELPVAYAPVEFNPVSEMRLRNQRLLEELMALWWKSPGVIPSFTMAYSIDEQRHNERYLDNQIGALIFEIKHIPTVASERVLWQKQCQPRLVEFASRIFRLEDRQIEFLERSGLIEASVKFARMARSFDPKISAEDIYQAGRNVMTANFVQVLMGMQVDVTPSIFAYSMLYPYTDNYLDDASVSTENKKDFNQRFRRWLEGELIEPSNHREETIFALVKMIEGEWPRGRYPQVYQSLLEIYAAQARSLELVKPGASPYDLNVLGISFEKGGTSVLADGYLVAGDLNDQQARILYSYGAFTQLMDDLEDLEPDREDGRMTIFSQTMQRWPLDTLTSRLFHFGRAIFRDMQSFDQQAAASLGELITHCLDPILLDIVGKAGRYYSKNYLRELEGHSAFRFAAIERQRRKFARQRIDVDQLVGLFI
jgi:hypothetical protein